MKSNPPPPLFSCLHADLLAPLFLQEDCYQDIADLVLLDPQWLMRAMKAVMELSPGAYATELSNTQLRTLFTDGIANFELLEVCWGRFIPESSSGIKVHHLILISQAYCLIYPLRTTRVLDEKYMIPCMLPDNIVDHKFTKNHRTFYMNFHRFLPNEIYYQLICVASSMCEVRQTMKAHNSFSKRSCLLHNLHDTNWVIEMEPEKQRLKITFL